MLTRRRAAALPMSALSLLAASCATASVADAGSVDEARVIDEYLAAYQAGDVERGLALMAEEVYFEDPTMDLLARNRDELRAIVQQGADAFSEVRITLLNRIHASPWTVLQQRLEGVILRPDGQTRRVDVQGVSLFEIRDAKIVRWYDYFDAIAFRQQTR